MTLRVVQVGLGEWGINWATTIVPQVSAVETVAYANRSPAKAEAARDRIGNSKARFFTSLAEALEVTRADAVLVLTTTEAHAELVRTALDKGAHVLVEKPFVADLDDGRTLVDHAESLGRVLMVNQNFRFFPAAERATELVREQALGVVSAISIDFRRSLAHLTAERAAQLFVIPDLLLSDLAIHHFDLMRMVTGTEPKRIYCTGWKPDATSQRDPLSAAAIITFEGGLIVKWEGSWEARGPETPFSGNWRIECARGEVHWACRGDRDLSLAGDRVEIITSDGRTADTLKKNRPFGRAGVLDAFARAVESGERSRYFPAARDNVKSLALMHAAVTSARTGQVVELR